MSKYKSKVKIHAKVVEEMSQDDKELISIVKSVNPKIVIPSSHLGFFRTVYAHLDVANLNNVILSEKAATEAIDTLIQSQVNFEHFRKGNICGQVLDAWINEENAIEIVFAFHKGVYTEKYEEAKEKLANGELNVSFELLSDKATQQFTEDGKVILNDVDFQGVGFLFDHDPADPFANVLEMAKVCKQRAESINKEERDFVFASEIINQCNDVISHDAEAKGILENEESLITKIKSNEEKGGTKSMNEEQLKLVADLRAEFGDNAKDYSDEDLLNEEKVAEIRKTLAEKTPSEDTEEAKSEEETVAEETKEEEAKEEDETPSEEAETTEEEPAKEETEEASEESEEEAGVTEELTRKTSFDVETKDDGSEVMTEKIEEERVTTYSSIEEAQAKVTELETEIEELKATLVAKDSEIEAVRANAETIGKMKTELKDNPYVADFSDEDYLNEDKVEKAKLKAENDKLKSALDSKETKEVKTEKIEANLETGKTVKEEETEIDTRDLFKRIR